MRYIETIIEIRGHAPGSKISCADSAMEAYVAAGEAKWVVDDEEMRDPDEDKPLEECSKEELIEVAKAFDLPIYGTKEDLIERINGAKFP